MKILKVPCTACVRYSQIEQVFSDVIARYSVDATPGKIADMQLIMEYNVLTTPALVVGEAGWITGSVPCGKDFLETLN